VQILRGGRGGTQRDAGDQGKDAAHGMP
jgi:hypothetical protein